MTHLKGSLGEMEQRMREMIDNEEELRKKVDQVSPSKGLSSIVVMQREMEGLRASLAMVKSENIEWKSKYNSVTERKDKLENELN